MTAQPTPRKILYQLVSPLHRAVGDAEVERRRDLLRAWGSPGLSIDIASPEEGPMVVESQIDAALVFPGLRALAPRWSEDGYDAVVLGCFSDPGIEALRELTRSAVIGPGEAALLAAVQFGETFSVLSSDPTPAGLRRRIRGMGFAGRFVSEHVVGASVDDLRRSPDRAFASIAARAEACIGDGAEVIVLGCLAMCFVPGLPERLQEATGVPVINPVVAGLKSAEAALHYGVARRIAAPAS